MTQDSGEALWLVKSGGRILGPYSKDEIVHLLEKKELVVLDEVLFPYQRWNYIRDESNFADVVEKIRVQAIESGEDPTATMSISAGTSTDGITEKIDGIYPDDLTDEISLGRDIKDAEFQDISSGNYRPRSTNRQADSYGFEGDRSIVDQSKGTPWYVTFLTALIILGTIGYVFYQRSLKAPLDEERQTTSSLESALRFMDTGRYAEALNVMNSIYLSDPKNLIIKEPYGLLLIQLEKQSALGRRLINESIKNSQTPMAKAFIALAVADLVDGDFEAAKSKLNKALEADPVNVRAMLNLAIAEELTGNYEEANSQVQAALKSSQALDEGNLIQAKINIKLWEKNKTENYLSETLDILNTKNKNFTYYQELLFLKTYLRFLLGQLQNPNEAIKEILDNDPLKSQLHKHDIYIFKNAISWTNFLPWCQEMAEKLNPTPHLVALEAFCLLKSDARIEAKKKIDVAVSQAPKDPLIQGIYAFILKSLSRNDEYDVALNTANDYNTETHYQLPVLLKARSCEEVSDWNCANHYWDRLIQKNSSSLAAIAGMTNILINDKELSTARDYLEKGIAYSRSYIPFLDLMDELSYQESNRSNGE